MARQNINSLHGLENVQRILGGKWKILLLWTLREGPMGSGKIQQELPNITRSMLTKQLRELEADHFVWREVIREAPPRVEYSLTPIGEDFLPIIQQMREWGIRNDHFFARFLHME